MADDVYFLCYSSTATAPEGSEQLAADITDIINIALERNKAMKVTGALFYANGYYCQVLEGQKAVVTNLVDHIRRDRRHSEIRTLAVGYRKQRNFAEWSMGYAGVLPSLPLEVQQLMTLPDEITSEHAGDIVSEFLLRHLEAGQS